MAFLRPWLKVLLSLAGRSSADGCDGQLQCLYCGLVAYLIPEDGQSAVLVLELHLILPHHLRLGIQVHADDANVGSDHHTKGKILQSVRSGTIACIVTVPQTV